MAVKPFSNEELNFLKFAAIVFDEFPKAIRQTFVAMWDNKIAVLPGYQLWDDSAAVRNMFLVTEGGKTDIPTNSSIDSWDCTALFKATIHAKTFALPGTTRTLAESYIKGRKPKPSSFHPTVISPSGNQDETLALAIDQLRLLRNKLCHSSERNMNKLSFDQYVKLAKDAFAALGLNTTSIDVIGSLTESDFPTKKIDELNESIQKVLRASNQFLQEEVIDKFGNFEHLGNQLRTLQIETVEEVKEMKIMASQLMQSRETGNIYTY